MSILYISKLEIVDDCNNKVFCLKEIPADKGLRKALNYIKMKDGSSTLKKIFKYLDDDFKVLLGMEDENEKK
jgi:hypothetical protein